jgi:hypothetical protein
MLKRHQCEIDLRRNVLRVQGVSDLEEIPFLAEHELPTNARGTLPEDVPGILWSTSSSSPVASRHAPSTFSSESKGKSEDEKLQELIALGFPADVAQTALHQANGDAELAAQLLLANMP